ncbi:MAG: ROK family protein [Mycobacteriales bacterium]
MLTIDLGGTRVKAALFDRGAVGDLVVVDHGADALEPALQAVDQLIQRLAPHGVKAVGLCVPGLVDDEGRVVALPGKLEGIVGADLVGWLRARTGGSAIVVNDAIAYGVGAAAELPGRTVVVTLGTGVGTAVIENGRPLGAGPLGGGLLGGQLPLTADGPPDTSGRGGTIEGWCRAARLLAEVRQAGFAAADVPSACDAALAGQPQAVRGVQNYRAWLARAVAALCLAYTPDTVVLGGGPVRPDGLLVDGLAEQVQPYLWPSQHLQVRASEHGDAAALMGLSRLARAAAPEGER